MKKLLHIFLCLAIVLCFGACGATWDEADDVSEEEAQLFYWTLAGSTLKHEHVGTFVTVPKIYTVTSLTSSELVYQDDFGVIHHFSKVE